MEAVERSLEDEKGCAEVLQLIAGVRGAINRLMAEVIEDHILLQRGRSRSRAKRTQ